MSSTPRQMKPFFRSLALWMLIAVILMMVFQFYRTGESDRTEITYSDFLSSVEQGRVTKVEIQGADVTGVLTDQTQFHTIRPDDPELVKTLRTAGVSIEVLPIKQNPFLLTLLTSLLPMVLLIAVWIFFMRQMQGGGKAMTFGKSRAKLLNQDETRVSFADVAGIQEAKEEVQEIVEFLRDPKKFTKLGGRIPKGVLLMGSPGTGKTLLARAIAGEAGVPFFSISGSDFVEMFVGVGASRVRDLFIQGKKSAPCIIFIDEIDAVGRHRGAGLGGGHDEREQTLNQLLVEMDGFESTEGVILMAATNRPDVLDPALLRPGRFDRQVIVPRPDIRGRAEILEVHSKAVPVGGDVDMQVIARGTPGFSGADLENLVNEAALAAARTGKDAVEMEDFEKAKDKVLMGSERRSITLSEEERRLTAYHEAGHAVVGVVLPNADPVHKVSIIPRGRALGVTVSLPVDERYTLTRDYLVDKIAVMLGGRAAEEIFLKQITTGAAQDIDTATEIARRMVCKYGMSEKMGPVSYGKEDEQIFLGKELVAHKDFSEQTAVEIDQEIRTLVEAGLERARALIAEHRDSVEALALLLLEKETLMADEVVRIVCGEDDAPEGGEGSAESETPEAPEAAETADVPGAVASAPAPERGEEEEIRQEAFDFGGKAG